MKTIHSQILVAILIAFPFLIGIAFIYYSCRHSKSPDENSAGDKKSAIPSDEFPSKFDE